MGGAHQWIILWKGTEHPFVFALWGAEEVDTVIAIKNFDRIVFTKSLFALYTSEHHVVNPLLLYCPLGDVSKKASNKAFHIGEKT
jgi:hypothetical protein